MEIASRPPLRRLVLLDRLIRAGDYPNARTAAEALEVHARTIHRDLEFLRDSLEAPLAFVTGVTAIITAIRLTPSHCCT